MKVKVQSAGAVPANENQTNTTKKGKDEMNICERKTTDEIQNIREQSQCQKRWSIATSAKEMRRLLNVCGLQGQKIIRIEPCVNRSTHRWSVVLTVQDRSDSSWSNLLIDFRLGNPTWEQFIDVAYDAGAEYNRKVIVFEYDLAGDNFSNAPDAICHIEDLVRYANCAGTAFYLVEAKGLISKMLDATNDDINYSLMAGPYGCDIDSPEKVFTDSSSARFFPTKRDVQVSEFWLGYYGPNWSTDELNRRNLVLNGWTPGHIVNADMLIHADWGDDGYFLKLVFCRDSETDDVSEGAIDSLRWIWANRQTLLKEYPANCISLEESDDLPVAISIRINEITIMELIAMMPQDKWRYAETVYTEEKRFRKIVGEAVRDYEKMKTKTKTNQA